MVELTADRYADIIKQLEQAYSMAFCSLIICLIALVGLLICVFIFYHFAFKGD